MEPKIDRRLHVYLTTAVRYDASDLHIQPGTAPYVRLGDQLRPVGEDKLNAHQIEEMIFSSISPAQKAELLEKHEIDYALELSDLGRRFRINAYTTQGSYAIVARLVTASPKSTEDLKLPSVLNKLVELNDGLILIAGSTGSGKSTTLAAMIDHINRTRSARIITIEDPIEILHPKKRSIISQREVGTDTDSFDVALRSALRQNPDIIMVGEIRDQATAVAAMQAAQTGHLVLSTIHAASAEECISRIINIFPEGERDNMRTIVATVLQAAMVQKLVPDLHGGKVPALEILLNTERVKSYILDPREDLITIMQEGDVHQMRTLDQDIVELIRQKVISRDAGRLAAADRLWLAQTLRRLGLDG